MVPYHTESSWQKPEKQLKTKAEVSAPSHLLPSMSQPLSLSYSPLPPLPVSPPSLLTPSLISLPLTSLPFSCTPLPSPISKVSLEGALWQFIFSDQGVHLGSSKELEEIKKMITRDNLEEVKQVLIQVALPKP